MPKRRRSSSVWGAFFLPLVGLCLVAIVVLLASLWSVTTRAEALFGPPAPGLSASQRLVLSTMLVTQSDDLLQPTYPGSPLVTFNIELGESLPSITGRLWEAGLIADPGAFRAYLQYTGMDTSLKAGEYMLSAGMPPVEIAQALQTTPLGSTTLAILAGWRIEEVAAALPSSGLEISPDEFLLAARIQPQGYSFSDQIPFDSTEGFLMPGTYEMERQTTASQLLAGILTNFDTSLSSEMRSGFSQQGLTLYQAVTLASIIEREAIIDDEMPLIASVFYNRLAIGERLAADPTVQYAIGYNASQGLWWTNPLSLQDLEYDSPYNTYLYTGLPPGPICNPGLTALNAAAFPADTPYYYFRAACDGSGRHLFARTFEEHLENACP